MPNAFMTAHRAPMAIRNNVPAVYYLSVFVRDGGLLSYGLDQLDAWRRAATYVDRILRGDQNQPMRAAASIGATIGCNMCLAVLAAWCSLPTRASCKRLAHRWAASVAGGCGGGFTTP
jgi:hypothetical protein